MSKSTNCYFEIYVEDESTQTDFELKSIIDREVAEEVYTSLVNNYGAENVHCYCVVSELKSTRIAATF